MLACSRFLRTSFLGFVFLFSTQAMAAEGVKNKLMIGKASVIPLQDFPSEMQTSIFSGVDKQVIDEMAPGGKTTSSINVFFVKAHGKNILIDTGLGASSGPRVSRLQQAMKEAGIRPEMIDTILITHLHGDHIGGVAWQGKKFFPKAKIYISQPEYDYWMSDAEMAKLPARKANFELVRKNLSLYKGRVKTFAPGSEVIPGFVSKETFGHTPGHVAFLLESKGQNLLFWGDVVHAAALQFANPNISASYDMNVEKAISTRLGVMKSVSQSKTPVAGVHLPFPGIGRVTEHSSGSFSYSAGL